MKLLSEQFVLVLGLGETGLSLARWLSAQGARVRVADSRAVPPGSEKLRRELPQVELRCGAFGDELLEGIDRIAISPGVPLAEPLVQRALARGIAVEGDIELLAQQINAARAAGDYPLSPTLSREGRGGEREKRPLILAITGANGKTTVTSMVGAMCEAAGLDTQVAGNISPAVLDALSKRGNRQPEIWVLELSSFQLETTNTLNADAAVVLNVTEDHLDRYEGMSGYAQAKARIFHGDGVQLVNRDDALSAAMLVEGRRHISFGLNAPGKPNPSQPSLAPARSTPVGSPLLRSDPSAVRGGADGSSPDKGGLGWVGVDWGISREGDVIWLMQGEQKIMRADELQVSGLHNVANALAALALCRAIDLPLAPLVAALRAFKGLPHRVEKVAEIAGITYYDDSKGTNVGATEAALNGLGKPAVVILGGEGKEQDFSPLKNAVAQHARAAVLIGRDAPLIEKALAGCGKPVLHARDMDEAVHIASGIAQPGDAVLMSPACASFDMYKNYLHRAEVFIAAVKKLDTEATCSAPH
ncbi:MAG: UDP-N-acetylmuramoyl-L-alanine--D-glutamate ligase [Sideroxydans sp.]|nr:UDP-N-acetylmuramoyl-L-alanine--D-glutamate ligase [Sideroxydans sp.]